MIKLCGKHYAAYFLFAALVAATALFVFWPSSQSGRVHANGGVELQLPYEPGQDWQITGGFDNGKSFRRPDSPHNHLEGGSLDLAPLHHGGWSPNMRDYWVVAAAGGEVIDKQSCSVKILHDDRRTTTEYLHVENIIVETGQRVSINQRLAVMAKTRRQAESCQSATAYGPHLHFSVRPQMEGVSLSGWVVDYDHIKDKTTLTKDGTTIGVYQPFRSTPLMCNFHIPVSGNNDNNNQPMYAKFISGGGDWAYKGRFSIYASNAISMKERPAGEQYRYSVAIYNRRLSNWDYTNYVVDLTSWCENIPIWQE